MSCIHEDLQFGQGGAWRHVDCMQAACRSPCHLAILTEALDTVKPSSHIHMQSHVTLSSSKVRAVRAI